MQRSALILAGVASLWLAGTAHADEPAPAPAPAIGPAPASAPAPAPAPAKFGWHDEWPRFSLAEAMVSVAVTFRNNDFGEALDGPNSATIKFEVPVLDPGFRGLLRGRTPQTINAAKRLSDLGFRTIVFVPYIFDVGVGAVLVHRDLDVAAQLALIDFEVLTLAGMTQLLASRVIGRARPYAKECETNQVACTGGPFRSFVGGHAMASFTAAGLICRHHAELPLFGGGAADTWACVWAVSVASMTSTLRVVADEHWSSDIAVGVGLGWLYGYYLPKLLHFHAKKMTAKAADGSRNAFTWLPTLMGTTDSGMLGIAGTF